MNFDTLTLLILGAVHICFVLFIIEEERKKKNR